MFKKICSLMLVTVLACGILGTVVSAKNNADTYYTFHVDAKVQNAYTQARAKEDSSSTYVNLNFAPFTYTYCDVQGYVAEGNTGLMQWKDKTCNGTIIMSLGKWLVRQTVYEHGGRSARLKFRRYNTDGYLGGCWSPDSSGSYTYAN